MKTAKSLIPKSKAKTAYGLLSEVRRLILAEPLRYDQGNYIQRGEGDGFPACGTIGCVAGWVATLKEPADFHYSETSAIAERVLGLSVYQADQLFDGDAARGQSQTPQHAKSGAAHIARFQKKYAAQLKAKIV